jgi:hypothetical protein
VRAANWLAISPRERAPHSSRLPPSQWAFCLASPGRRDAETRRCTVRSRRRRKSPVRIYAAFFPSSPLRGYPWQQSAGRSRCDSGVLLLREGFWEIG